jgi:hypothetical protein
MRMRLAWFSGFAVAVILTVAGARPAPAQQPAGQVVRLGEGQTLTISGLVSSTMFLNNGRFGGFGQGQNAAWADSTQPATDKTFLDADVRNTRINFTVNAQPVLGKFAPRVVLEADFFGAFNGAPPFGDEQAQLRIRFAYVDLTNGRTTLRIGQFWSPLFGAVPVSLSHVAFPLGYGAAGKVGWRFPGIFLYHDLTPGKPVAIQLQLAAFEGSGPTAPGKDTPLNTGIGHGEASGKPQLEALLNFSKRSPNLSWNLYVVGHVDWKDTTGTGAAGDDLTGTAFELGGSIAPGKLTVQGNVYTGKAIGQQFGHITQQGNVRGVGGWVQGGYDFTPRWSLWAFYGLDDPDEAESPGLPTTTGARLKNQEIAGMVRFRAGRYQLGLEVLQATTTWRAVAAATPVERDATQIALSVLYTF